MVKRAFLEFLGFLESFSMASQQYGIDESYDSSQHENVVYQCVVSLQRPVDQSEERIGEEGEKPVEEIEKAIHNSEQTVREEQKRGLGLQTSLNGLKNTNSGPKASLTVNQLT